MGSIRALSYRLAAAAVVAVVVSGCEFGDTQLAGEPVCSVKPECSGAPDLLANCRAESDAYDCMILQWASEANEPDPMIFKAQIGLESNFDEFAISPDTPCDTKMGWTWDESKSFGLLQLTPACGWLRGALLPDGHPNMAMDMAAPEWATSVFNPAMNVTEGIRAVQVNREHLVTKFPGCTEVQYTKMALAAFNRGSSAVTGCDLMSAPAQGYVASVLFRYSALARVAGWADPY